MQYPLKLTSYWLGRATTILDASGAVILRSDGLTINTGTQGSNRVCKINFDGWLGISPKIHLLESNGESLFTVKRNTLVSLWQSSYDIIVGNTLVAKIREGKALGKILGGVFDGTVLEPITEKVWQPAFVVCRPDGQIITVLEKRRSIFKTKFTIKKKVEMTEAEERIILLSLFAFSWLEHTFA